MIKKAEKRLLGFSAYKALGEEYLTKIIKKNEEVIKNKDEVIKKLRKENEDLKKNDVQSNFSSSSSTSSNNIITSSKGFFYILSYFIYYFITCVFNDMKWDGIGCCVFINDFVL
jgi:hypothetical protein